MKQSETKNFILTLIYTRHRMAHGTHQTSCNHHWHLCTARSFPAYCLCSSNATVEGKE